MKVTWEDFVGHRYAATPRQWRRMEAYFNQGQTLAEIARAEGIKSKHTNSVELSIGRGCMAVLRSVLGQPVRVPSEVPTATAMRKLRAQLAPENAASSSQKPCSPQAQASTAKATVAYEFTSPTPDSEAFRAPLASLLCEADMRALRSSLKPVTLGMRVAGQHKRGHGAGRVERLEGDMAVVVWDSGFKSFASVAQLSPVDA